jgi:acyl carrier protein phosphodiesterase
MNLLAHAYLSFGNEQVLVGNLISDYVKGSAQYNFPKGIQQGIQLHRKIDTFTDVHESTKVLKNLFTQHYRLYAGAIVDVVYDYFLANDELHFPNNATLQSFTQKTYAQLQNNTKYFPEKFAGMFPYMQTQNWLYNYRENEGMQKAFNGLARRAKYMADANLAYEIFLEKKEYILPYYKIFIADVYAMAQQEYQRFVG